MYIIPIISKRRALLSYVLLPIVVFKCASSQLVVTSLGEELKGHENSDVMRKTTENTIENVVIYEGKKSASWRQWTSYLNGGKGKNLYACGAQVQVQAMNDEDNTAVNGLKLKYCGKGEKWEESMNAIVWRGDKGNWKKMKTCPDKRYIVGARVRYQNHVPKDGRDNMAITGFKIKCGKIVNFKNGNDESILDVFSNDKLNGSWKPMISFARKRAIIGARVKYQDYSDGKDNIGMHGIQFKTKSTEEPEEKPVDSKPKGSCRKPRISCDEDANCFWSDSWNRCRTCSALQSKNRCNNMGCSWDDDNNSCSSSQPPSTPSQDCSMTMDENDCNDEEICYWNNSKKSCQSCSAIKREDKCNTKGCSWDANANICS